MIFEFTHNRDEIYQIDGCIKKDNQINSLTIHFVNSKYLLVELKKK